MSVMEKETTRSWNQQSHLSFSAYMSLSPCPLRQGITVQKFPVAAFPFATFIHKRKLNLNMEML